MKRRDFTKRATIQTLAATTLPGALLADDVIVEEIDPEPQSKQASDLVDLFVSHMRLCRVTAGETFLFYTTPSYARPEYITAGLAAAKMLGANAFSLVATSNSNPLAKNPVEKSDLLLKAFMGADVVYGQIPLYDEAHNIAVQQNGGEGVAKSGTRTLMVSQPVESLKRLFPNEDVIRRTKRGSKRIAAASEIRLTDDQGTDLRLGKAGRKGAYGCGVSDIPGRWDHWPSGLVTCAPNEDEAEGVYIVNPGDIILGLRHRCTSQVKITMEAGRITSIEGGYDAQMIQERLELYDGASDPETYLDADGHFSDPYRIAHAGWGCEHRAQWHILGMDSEPMYGNTMFSFGRNMFDSLGGANWTNVHIDICCRNKSVYLDDELIVENNKIIPPDLA